MTIAELPALKDEGCTKCGCKSFLLSVDYTDYSTYEHEDGAWVYGSTSSEPSSAEKSVRFYCTHCGTDHLVPQGVEP